MQVRGTGFGDDTAKPNTMTNRKNIAARIGWPAFMLSGMLIAGCGPAEQAENTKEKVDSGIEQLNDDLRADLEKDKAELTADLERLKVRTETKILNFDERLRDDKLTPAERKELEDARKELKGQLTRIEVATSNVGVATRDSWLEVKDATDKVVDDIDGWFARQAEKMDKKTDADRDGDGH
jgi:hypothetical protein